MNFTRASEELHLSQSAVSQQIKSLENAVGVELFQRGGFGVSLTKAGGVFLRHADKILSLGEEMRREIETRSHELAGRITIGGATRGLYNPYFELYKAFQIRFPDIELTFQSEYSSQKVMTKVASGEIDIGIVPETHPFPGVESVQYADYRPRIIVSKNHPFASRKVVSESELEWERWICFESGNPNREAVESTLANYDFHPKCRFETNDGSLILTMVAHGEGITCLPSWGIDIAARSGVVEIDVEEWEIVFRLCLIYRADRNDSALRTARNYILESPVHGLELVERNVDNVSDD